METKNIKQTRSDRIFDIVNYFLLALILLLYVYPLLYIVNASFTDPVTLNNGDMLLFPKKIFLDGYTRILNYGAIWTGYRNTLFYTVLGTMINLVLVVITAYPLSRKDFLAGKFLSKLYMFTMFFSGGLIPTYLLIRGMGLLNTVWVMVIPGALNVWNLIITRTYFQTSIPESLQEAASIDGATNIKFLTSVVLPLSKPILAVMVLFHGVAHWNAFFNALLYLSNRELLPLQLILRDILVQSQMQQEMMGDVNAAFEQMLLSESIKYGVIIVASLPVLVAYPFVQKYFIKGMLIGSVKG